MVYIRSIGGNRAPSPLTKTTMTKDGFHWLASRPGVESVDVHTDADIGSKDASYLFTVVRYENGRVYVKDDINGEGGYCDSYTDLPGERFIAKGKDFHTGVDFEFALM